LHRHVFLHVVVIIIVIVIMPVRAAWRIGYNDRTLIAKAEY